MQVKTLNCITSTLAATKGPREPILAGPHYSFQQSWFIRLLVGDRDPLTEAEDVSIQGKRRGSVQRSRSLQLLNQSWQRSASTDMRCSKENVCVCLSIKVCKRVCVCVCLAERPMRERQKERVSHTHTQEPVKGQRLVLTAQDRKWHTHMFCSCTCT